MRPRSLFVSSTNAYINGAKILQIERKNKNESIFRSRLCVTCRREKSRNELLRLTFDYKTKQVQLNGSSAQDRLLNGRSAYLCRQISCVDSALKGNRLRIALEGRKPKGQPSRRQIAWPLASQLVHTVRSMCTDTLETCQNT